MKRFLVGDGSQSFCEESFRIIQADSETAALFLFAKRFGIRESWFVEEVFYVGFGNTAASPFWAIHETYGHDLPKMSFPQKSDVERFETNVRAAFVHHPQYGEMYIAKCREARESGEWEISSGLPDELQAVLWLKQYADAMHTIDLEAFESNEAPTN